MIEFQKDPHAVLDYAVDWSAWLGVGETITTSTMTVPTGITKNSESHSGTSATVWLAGGTAGTRYQINNLIVTSANRTDQRSFVIVVQNR